MSRLKRKVVTEIASAIELCRFCGVESKRLSHVADWNDVGANWIKYLPFEITNEDELPKALCTSCKMQLENIGQFFTKIIKVQEQHRQTTLESFKKPVVAAPILFVRKSTELKDPGIPFKPVTIKVEPVEKPYETSSVSSILEKIKKTGVSVVRVEKLVEIEKTPPKSSYLMINSTKSIKPESFVNTKYSSLTIEPNITHDFEPTDDDSTMDNDYVSPDCIFMNEDDDDVDFENDIDEDDNDPDYGSSKDSFVKNKTSAKKPEGGSSLRKSTKMSNDYPTYDMPNLAYVCANCRGRFTSQELLEEHMQQGGDCHSQSLTCKQCARMFPTKKQLSRHVDAMHRSHPVYKCDVCKRNYSNEELLMAHLPMCNGDFEDNSGIMYKCKECDLQFLSKRELFEHIAMHPKSMLCDLCGKSCPNRKAYHQHKREHLKLKPYVCEYCAKTFRSRVLLSSHQHVHTGVKAWGCELCDKRFAKKASLISHMRLHTGECPYACTDCDERFVSLEKLKTHRKRHIEQNLY